MRRWLAITYAAGIGWVIWCANDAERQHVFATVRTWPLADKLGHFLLLGGLALVVNLALHHREFTWRGRRWLTGSALVLVFVVGEEISQLWIPSRRFDPLDLVGDVLGILFFGWAARRWMARQRGAATTRDRLPGPAAPGG